MSEPDVSDLKTVAEAIAIIDRVPIPPPAGVLCPVARDHVLAADVLADSDYPPFDKSLMDGYAIVCDGQRQFTLVGEVAAGGVFDRPVQPGEAVAIMTGAPMPAGADGVVPVEDAVVDGQQIHVQCDIKPGRYIAQRGSDCSAGSVVLRRGDRLGPANIAVAATVGAKTVATYPMPTAAILTTGNEIVIGREPGTGQIRDANGPMLSALVRRLGCIADEPRHVVDTPGEIRAAIEDAVASRNVLFVTGGMSMGKYDYVPAILREIGFDLHVTKLRIKPGKPFVFGSRKEKFVFGLPGNPVSAFVCTLRLASRLIARLQGEVVVERWIDAELESPLPANGPREFYQPAMLVRTGNRILVRPLQWKGSADVFTLAKADGLLVRPENAPQRSAGERVQLLEVPR